MSKEESAPKFYRTEMVKIKQALNTICLDAIRTDDGSQWIITDWAMQKVRQAMGSDVFLETPPSVLPNDAGLREAIIYAIEQLEAYREKHFDSETYYAAERELKGLQLTLESYLDQTKADNLIAVSETLTFLKREDNPGWPTVTFSECPNCARYRELDDKTHETIEAFRSQKRELLKRIAELQAELNAVCESENRLSVRCKELELENLKALQDCGDLAGEKQKLEAEVERLDIKAGMYSLETMEVEKERDKLKADLAIATEALEDCTGGDLASGDGIYKAEIASEALERIKGNASE